MTTVSVLGLAGAGSWSVTIGGGWIVLTLIAVTVCCLAMIGSMTFARGRPGWSVCGPWRLPDAPTDRRAERADTRSRSTVTTISPERPGGRRGSASEARR